jgi:hypothetical protein
MQMSSTVTWLWCPTLHGLVSPLRGGVLVPMARRFHSRTGTVLLMDLRSHFTVVMGPVSHGDEGTAAADALVM